MNMLRLIIALLVLVLGLIVGFQNSSPPIELKLLVFSWQTTPGYAFILALLSGVVIGALAVLATLVWPLYSKLRKAGRQATSATSGPGH